MTVISDQITIPAYLKFVIISVTVMYDFVAPRLGEEKFTDDVL